MLRTRLYADPHGRFVHDLIFESCSRFPHKTAIIDSSCDESSLNRRITYAQYAELVERLARGLAAAGLKPEEVLAIYLPNCWEFCAVYHAATLAGAIPTLLNPSYREREVRYQLENSGAALLISDGPLLQGDQSRRSSRPASRLHNAPIGAWSRTIFQPAETCFGRVPHPG